MAVAVAAVVAAAAAVVAVDRSRFVSSSWGYLAGRRRRRLCICMDVVTRLLSATCRRRAAPTAAAHEAHAAQARARRARVADQWARIARGVLRLEHRRKVWAHLGQWLQAVKRRGQGRGHPLLG